MKTEKEYVHPTAEVITVDVEMGFSVSPEGDHDSFEWGGDLN